MLRIRQEQIDAIAENRVREFKGRIRGHLEKVLPDHGLEWSRTQIEEQIDRGINQAKCYKLTRQRDVARYIEAVCCYLNGFTDDPHPKQARTILYDFRVAPGERVKRFREWLEAHAGAAT